MNPVFEAVSNSPHLFVPSLFSAPSSLQFSVGESVHNSDGGSLAPLFNCSVAEITGVFYAFYELSKI